MTKEEAIVVLKNEQPHCGKKALFSEEKKYEAYDVAIKALEQEPCEDCISRESVFAIAGDSCLDLNSYEDTKEFCDEIKDLPPVTPQPKTGGWIEHFDESGKWYECDQCHTDWGGPVNYCPNCGCAMGVDKR